MERQSLTKVTGTNKMKFYRRRPPPALPSPRGRPLSSGGARLFLLLLVVLSGSRTCTADIIIGEIADKGSSSVCGGSDWLELYNIASVETNETVDLSGYILHDDGGMNDTNAFTFPQGQQLLPGEYLLLCTRGNDPLLSPQFKIGGDDTLTLINAARETVASVGPLPDGDERNIDVTYAWNSTDTVQISYMYTSTPTPGSTNILTPVINETPEQLKKRLALQNAQGTRFFGMDDNGYPIPDGLGEVLDLHLTMEPADYDYLIQNASFQLYRPFTSARVVRTYGGFEEELLALSSPGRLRPKGQSTLYVSNCVGTEAMPYLIEFNTVNKTQTLFGVERMFLRMHFRDNSYMREWTAHRMLARFKLPHLRARMMRLHINGNRIGFYTVLEAAEQAYVFHRSFPTYNPDDYALYKVKTLSRRCGQYEPDRLEVAQMRIEETATPPYSFDRGEHREPTPVLEQPLRCLNNFIDHLKEVELADVELAYLRADENCGKMLVEQGLIDRDLGTKGWDLKMEDFINEHLADNKCDEGCRNSNLAAEVDIENVLKSFAFYAVTLNMDSPLGNGNNYYLAETGDGMGWKIVGYDHNSAGSVSCPWYECNPHLLYWSILRPTCTALEDNQLVGPLLTNATLHAQYIEYVRDFTNSVLGNASFVEEMVSHAQAIEEDVKDDYWGSGGIFYAKELSPDAAEWSDIGFPLLPFYKARAEEVQKQLEALDEGTFPNRDVPPDEKCVDWRTTNSPSKPGW